MFIDVGFIALKDCPVSQQFHPQHDLPLMLVIQKHGLHKASVSLIFYWTLIFVSKAMPIRWIVFIEAFFLRVPDIWRFFRYNLHSLLAF